ncbi:MAG: hypothetical protein FJ091_11420 [Deltaproteobacteria bacterium]|nr:hypothetical protein [Deltaproteobacteria bacterium]
MRKLGLVLVLLFAATSALAQASGNGSLSGTARIKVKPECRKNRQAVNADWVLSGNGFSAQTPGNGTPALTGSATAQGASSRIFRLSFDAPSKAIFDAALESWATFVCGGTPVTLTSVSVTHFDLKLNKRKTRAKVKLYASGTGTSPLGPGTGS